MLNDTETAILDLEQQWFARSGTKDAAIWERFQMLPPAYYAKLNWLIDREAAMAYAPLLVGRLRRLRDARVAARCG